MFYIMAEGETTLKMLHGGRATALALDSMFDPPSKVNV